MNIDILEILKGVPDTHEKIFKLIFGLIGELDEKVKKFDPELKLANRYSDSIELSAVAVNTLVKNTEKYLISKLSNQETKVSVKFEALENELAGLKILMNKEVSSLYTKITQNNFEERLQTVKKEVKQEISESLIDPIEFEMRENYKSLQLLEQTLKLHSWNIEATEKEFNNRFEVHREKICKIESSVQDFLGQADDLILGIINPIKKEVELCEITIKNIYSDFERDLEEVMADLLSKDEDRQKHYSDHLTTVASFNSDISETVKEIKKTLHSHIQDVESITNKMRNQIEIFKSEILIAQKDIYHQVKAELVKGYKNEIFSIEEKLKWLPSQIQDISDMTPAEARLYTIETRIRTEEANRMKQVNKMFNGNA